MNEVQVPDVVGSTLAAAKQRLLLQPLETAVVYEPAKQGQKVGVVVAQFPKGGTLSSWQKVTVVLGEVAARRRAAGRRAHGHARESQARAS